MIEASALRDLSPGTSLLTSLDALLRKETQYRPADSSFEGHAPVIMWVGFSGMKTYIHILEKKYT